MSIAGTFIFALPGRRPPRRRSAPRRLPGRRVRILWVAIAAGGIGWPTVLPAHDTSTLDARVTLTREGNYRVELSLHLDALALGVPPSSDPAEVLRELQRLPSRELEWRIADLRDLLARRTRIRFDGVKQVPHVRFPTAESPPLGGGDPATLLGPVALLEGPIPDGAVEFTFGASRSFGPAQLRIFEQATGAERVFPLEPGEDCPPFTLGASATPDSAASILGRYVVAGFRHILPLGLDHVLFVLGLFLLSARMRPLLLQITTFTVAHTVTLALASHGIFELPSRWVETLIALSIVYVAVENLLTRRLKPWRLALVFLFGLLHGLGFAGVLLKVGLPRGMLWPALLGFNVGVELGQVTVVLLALLTVGWFRDREWYGRRIVVPASLAIGGVAAYWSITRALSA